MLCGAVMRICEERDLHQPAGERLLIWSSLQAEVRGAPGELLYGCHDIVDPSEFDA